MKVKLPEDFKPTQVKAPKGEEETPDSQWWIYTEDGTGKKYGEATKEEVFQFAKGMFADFPMKDASRLGLRVARSAILDVCLGVAIHQHRNLFGGPELWENLEDWERAPLLKKKED